MTTRGAAAAGALLIVLAVLTGCVGASDRYADLRDRLAADPAILYVEGSDSSMPSVTNVSLISANIDPSASTADIQRVAEIVRSELEPLSYDGPDPEVTFDIGAPTDDLDTLYPRLVLSEFTIDKPTLAAEIAYWRDLDAATDGAASGFAIEFPVWGSGDYERSIGFRIERGLPTAARVATFRTVAAVDDPTGAGTHWAVTFAPESFVLTNSGREPMSSDLGLPSTEVLDLWDRVLVPLPGGGQPALQSEWSAPLAGGQVFDTSLILRVQFPDEPEAWDRLVEVSAAALGLADDVAVIGGSAAFSVYVFTGCDDGQVKQRDRERDRSGELIAALGAEGERLGICDD